MLLQLFLYFSVQIETENYKLIYESQFNEEPKTIADTTINLAKKANSDVHKVAISGMIPRRDRHNQKVKQVNDILKQSCVDENIPFISHHGINNPRLHLNDRGLHLNDKGSSRLADNSRNFLSESELG